MKAIHILALGGTRIDLADDLLLPLKGVFRVPAHRVDLEVDLERFYDDARTQYNSTEILLHLKELYRVRGHPNGVKAMAIVPCDLFIPILTYVFGEAEVGGNVAIVSSYRLAPERYGLAPDAGLHADRLFKEVVHELGHAHGLVHCLTQECVMHSSSSVEEIDLKGRAFCTACAAILAHH
jgi:archaemetzincin